MSPIYLSSQICDTPASKSRQSNQKLDDMLILHCFYEQCHNKIMELQIPTMPEHKQDIFNEKLGQF